jgi:hypothetical protein
MPVKINHTIRLFSDYESNEGDEHVEQDEWLADYEAEDSYIIIKIHSTVHIKRVYIIATQCKFTHMRTYFLNVSVAGSLKIKSKPCRNDPPHTYK